MKFMEQCWRFHLLEQKSVERRWREWSGGGGCTMSNKNLWSTSSSLGGKMCSPGAGTTSHIPGTEMVQACMQAITQGMALRNEF